MNLALVGSDGRVTIVAANGCLSEILEKLRGWAGIGLVTGLGLIGAPASDPLGTPLPFDKVVIGVPGKTSVAPRAGVEHPSVEDQAEAVWRVATTTNTVAPNVADEQATTPQQAAQYESMLRYWQNEVVR